MNKSSIFVLLFALLLPACATTHRGDYNGNNDVVIMDPSYLRVVFINPTGYSLKTGGELTEPMKPNEVTTKNLKCAGKHRVIAHAYRQVGQSVGGTPYGIFVGDMDVTFYVDPAAAFNYNGQIVSAVVSLGYPVLNQNYPYPNVFLPMYAPCSIFTPDVTIEKTP